MKFVKTSGFKINLRPEQLSNLSSLDKINQLIQKPDIISFDIFNKKHLVGFAILKEFESGKFFLWDFAIDYKWQNKGIGTRALQEMVELLKKESNANTITTTCKTDNSEAIEFFHKNGFENWNAIDEFNAKEKNLILKLNQGG